MTPAITHIAGVRPPDAVRAREMVSLPGDLVNGGKELREHATDWLWHHRIPMSSVTLLVGGPKSGKSTLLRGLLRAAEESAAIAAAKEDPDVGWADYCDWTLATYLAEHVYPLGELVDGEPRRALIITEEPPAAWRRPPAGAIVRHISHPPISSRRAWTSYIEDLAADATRDRVCLIVIDSLSRLLGVDENQAKKITAALSQLRRLHEDEDHSRSIIVTHHAGRSGSTRGSTALEASVDTVATLALPDGADDLDPRRVLTINSRLHPRPQRILYVMRDDGHLCIHEPARASLSTDGPLRGRMRGKH